MPTVRVTSEKTTSNPAIAGTSFLAQLFWFDIPAPSASIKPMVYATIYLYYNVSLTEAEEWELKDKKTSALIRETNGVFGPMMYPPLVEGAELIPAKLEGEVVYLKQLTTDWATLLPSPHYLNVDNS